MLVIRSDIQIITILLWSWVAFFKLHELLNINVFENDKLNCVNGSCIHIYTYFDSCLVWGENLLKREHYIAAHFEKFELSDISSRVITIMFQFKLLESRFLPGLLPHAAPYQVSTPFTPRLPPPRLPPLHV